MLCPECETKNHLSTLDMTPELLEEMVQTQEVTDDTVTTEVYQTRLAICRECSKLIAGMTCSECGCFVQFRARHKTASCINGRW